jgi:archaellum component FlaF (FlaF/FlaG flagellin family)
MNEKMKSVLKVLKTILLVYMGICTFLFTILLIGALVAWLNIGKITSYALNTAVDNYNTEINRFANDYFKGEIPNNHLQFTSIKTQSDGSIAASFTLSNAVISSADTGSFNNKTARQIINDIGMAPRDLPIDINPLSSIIKQKWYIDFLDENGFIAASREVTLAELAQFLSMQVGTIADYTGTPGINETFVTVTRERSNIGAVTAFQILVDGTIIALVNNGNTVQFAVPKGRRTIVVVQSEVGNRSNELTFDAQSTEITFSTTFTASGITIRRTN